MIIRTHIKQVVSTILLLIIYMVSMQTVHAQLSVFVNLAQTEGIEISSSNVFNFSILNNDNFNRQVTVKGTLIYRNSPLRFSYSFDATLYPGNNQFSPERVNSPNWIFSDNALRELFFDYKKLPQGTYEYCVDVELQSINPEQKVGTPTGACSYYTVNDIFLINLISPENDAKIYEYYPLLSWVVNYPFANELEYRIRVAELKKGQNNENAITRNNPVYKDNNVFSTSLMYPVTAKPLEAMKPYAWTVDAYYKGLLLGGAEAWKFTIIEDSLIEDLPYNNSYIDVCREQGVQVFPNTGNLKLKYVLEDLKSDTLHMRLEKDNGKEVKLKNGYWLVKYGDNRTIIDFVDGGRLKHMKIYHLYIVNGKGKQYVIPFKYQNPAFTGEVNNR
mgnify:CR=1 FL=1